MKLFPILASLVLASTVLAANETDLSGADEMTIKATAIADARMFYNAHYHAINKTKELTYADCGELGFGRAVAHHLTDYQKQLTFALAFGEEINHLDIFGVDAQ